MTDRSSASLPAFRFPRLLAGLLLGLALVGWAGGARAHAEPAESFLEIKCKPFEANWVGVRPSHSEAPFVTVAVQTNAAADQTDAVANPRNIFIPLPPPGVPKSPRYDIQAEYRGWLYIYSSTSLSVAPMVDNGSLTITLERGHLIMHRVIALALLVTALVAGLVKARRRGRVLEQRVDQAVRDKEIMASSRLGDSELPLMLGRKLRTEHDRTLEILRKIGNGNMGAVFEAVWRDGSSGRNESWAVKVPFRDIVVQTESRRRFLREAEICNHVSHSGLVQVLDWGTFDAPEDPEAGAWPFLVMEMMDGRTLRDALEHEGTAGLPLPQAIGWAREMVLALRQMHDALIVHRDLKPDNVFVTRAGHVKIGDFGLSGRVDRHSVTQTGEAFGTPLYMSPEHLEAQSTTGASDIYSLGVIVYEMLCGEAPFMADSTVAVLNRMLTEEPQPLTERRPDIPEALNSLVLDMMARNPDDRPRTEEILKRLDDVEGRAPEGDDV